MARLASIDLGSNTFRLLIIDSNQRLPFKTIYSENRITRIGEGFSRQNRISGQAIQGTISVLKHFQNILKKENVEKLVVTGTSAVRKAKNKAQFLEAICQHTGFRVEVLSGEEEARYTFLGVKLVFNLQEKWRESTVLVDIGGGSTEFIISKKGVPSALLTTALGAVTLNEKYLQSDPPTSKEISNLEDEVLGELEKISQRFPSRCRFIGTAGTITTLAAIEQKMRYYNPKQINGFLLTQDMIQHRLRVFSGTPIFEWRGLPGIEKGREDILVAGILILLCVMNRFKYQQIVVSDYGLREGILWDRFIK